MTTGTAIVARNSDLALAGPLGSLDAYLDRVSRIPVLSREEEKELASAIEVRKTWAPLVSSSSRT